jgi:ribosomal protein L7/L12
MDSRLTPEQSAAVRAAIARDAKIEAIKLYREATGLGLAESKDAVEELERTLGPASSETSRLLTSPRPVPPPPTGMTPEKRAALIDALRDGNKIGAIKLFLDATGLGLAESKDAVEAMEAALDAGEEPGPPSSLPVSRGATDAPSGAPGGPGIAPDGRTPLPNWDPFEEKKRRGCLGLLAILALITWGGMSLMAALW